MPLSEFKTPLRSPHNHSQQQLCRWWVADCCTHGQQGAGGSRTHLVAPSPPACPALESSPCPLLQVRWVPACYQHATRPVQEQQHEQCLTQVTTRYFAYQCLYLGVCILNSFHYHPVPGKGVQSCWVNVRLQQRETSARTSDCER